MKRVLIVDALNAYLRAYIVDPSLSTNGQPIGGLKGFIKILQKLVRQTKPDAVVVCWDGPNGSKNGQELQGRPQADPPEQSVPQSHRRRRATEQDLATGPRGRIS